MVKPGLGHDIDRLAHRRTDGRHRLDVTEAWRIEHVGTGLLEGLQPLDRVVDVGLAPRGNSRPAR